MFDDGSENVCKLQKSTYSFKQSGRVWNETNNNELLNISVVKGKVDQ